MIVNRRYKCGNCGHFDIKEEQEEVLKIKINCPKCKTVSGFTKESIIGNKRVGVDITRKK